MPEKLMRKRGHAHKGIAKSRTQLRPANTACNEDNANTSTKIPQAYDIVSFKKANNSMHNSHH